MCAFVENLSSLPSPATGLHTSVPVAAGLHVCVCVHAYGPVQLSCCMSVHASLLGRQQGYDLTYCRAEQFRIR